MASEGDINKIPARRGRAVRLGKGQSIKIINTHGQQVVDTWCFSAEDLTEFMSMEHMRPTIGRLWPRQGDGLQTNRRRPFLYLVEDTWRTTPRSRPATTTATACWGAKSTTTTAPTTSGRGCGSSASRCRRCRAR